MTKITKIILIIGIAFVLALISTFIYLYRQNRRVNENLNENTNINSNINDNQNLNQNLNKTPEGLKEPIEGAGTRITKKPFGIFIAPNNSPVSPEVNYGYHTGVDFEVTNDELNKEIAIFAICRGRVYRKENLSGYGGVIVQNCTIENQTVSVIYGHLDLVTSKIKINQIVLEGQKLAFLAPAGSEETWYERKHLHLGIYKGKTIDRSGYVDTKEELNKWFNPSEVLNL